LSETAGKELVRLRIDASKCDGQGVCKLFAPEWFELDRYGLAYTLPEAEALDGGDRDLWDLMQEAEATCPRSAIRIERRLALPDADAVEAAAGTPPARGPAPGEARLLCGDTVDEWRAAGGFTRREPGALFAEVRAAWLRGHGGANFATARKWAALGPDATLVANGAEREPGTVKDAYLLGVRPHLVLDGALATAHDRGITRIIVAIPEGEADLRASLEAARDAIGADVDIREVTRAYVGGEETALLAAIEGNPALPRMRPPFPAERGLNGEPTLVQNVETLAQVALLNAYGADWFRSAGTEDDPGTGLFSIGRYGGDFELRELPYGTLISDVVDRGQAVLAGGYSGGVLRSDQLDVPLTATALAGLGARLGTKSLQMIPAGTCPLRVVVEVLEFFATETAQQCPPCHRGLPEMAELMSRVERGEADETVVAEVRTFNETLFKRGLCALPDGAATVTLSYLNNFVDDLEAHLASGCPHR
jgi:NADH:ubiquinone oxidoreductase subunit F (NADH-binding)/ferredoxin